MAIPDSINTPPGFLQETPDWKKPYAFEAAWDTFIKVGHSGAEQRTRRRSRPRYKISYTLSALNLAQFSVRKAQAILDTGRPLVVPIWSAYQSMVLPPIFNPDVATMLGPLTYKAFKVGSYAYFEQDGLTSVFRRITAIAGNDLTLATGNAAFPNIAVPAYTGAVLVYPCIFGMRSENSAGFTSERLDSSDETIAVEEL